jgi:hypothetical protein
VKDGCACFATNTVVTARQDFKRSARPQIGVVLRWRKLNRVKLVEGVWYTAPNHSRPGSCVVEADIDAEDHPQREPQNGH